MVYWLNLWNHRKIIKMDIFTSCATFIIIWWLSLFLVLPIGIQSQLESGDVVKGTPRGAPSNPNIKKKMLWATGIASVFWLVLEALVLMNIVKL